MSWFRIVKGELVVPEGCVDFDEAWDEFGTTKMEEYRPKPGEPTVVIADALGQVFAVPENKILYADDMGYVTLFRATDEDNGGREVMVAQDDDGQWQIVPSGTWAQMPKSERLVQYFETLEEAMACLGDEKIALQPVDDVCGWRCVLVHGCQGVSSNLPEYMRTPRLIEALQIPEVKLHFTNLLTIGWDLDELLQGGPYPEFADCRIGNIIITPDCEVFIWAWAPDCEEAEVGVRVYSRLFTLDEAAVMLAL